jgi:translation initiation factor 3 subunit B
MHWQSAGKYLSVKIDRHTKNKKKTFVNFELFRVFEKDIPIENLELKDPVHAFSWEVRL